MLPSTTIYPRKSPSHQVWLKALKMLLLHQHLPAPFTNYWSTPVTDTQGVQAGSDIKEGKALMTHHVYSWTAACQNASRSSHTPTLQLAPKPPQHWFSNTTGTFRLALCFSSSGYIPKETGKSSINLCLSKLRSPLLWEVTKPYLDLPPHFPHCLPTHLRRDREGATSNCLLFPSWEEAVLLQCTQNK